MGHSTKKRVARQVAVERKELDEAEGLPYENMLSVEKVLSVIECLGITFRSRIYNPYVTLLAFLSQVTAKDGTCEDAVLRAKKRRQDKHPYLTEPRDQARKRLAA